MEERGRKQSLESRGTALVTSSGAFVSVVLAVATLADTRALDVPRDAVLSLAAAVACLLAAAVCGVLANMPTGYQEPDAAELARYIDDYWDADGSAAARVVATNSADNLKSARTANATKATVLRVGTAVEAAGLVLLAVTAALTLTL